MSGLSTIIMQMFNYGILASIQAGDTQTALSLLNDHQAAFFDPVEGGLMHAEALYCAIKNANQEVIHFLLNMPVLSDIAFFKFCGHTPLSYAIEENHKEMLPLLIARTDKNFALHMAVKLNQIKTKALLLSKCVFKKKLLQLLNLAPKK